ncbi:MAG: hypothetical protein SFV54_23620 [Bryobacteraceae bacterium]|nr:hypothetical protein [Bryobacteraceae bacterium]
MTRRLAAGLFLVTALPGQFGQATYSGETITGQFTLVRVVNLSQQAQPALPLKPKSMTEAAAEWEAALPVRETAPQITPRQLRPPLLGVSKPGSGSIRAAAEHMATNVAPASYPVVVGGAGLGFNGPTHLDQRLANGGNQFSIEPPSPSLAVGSGFVLAGVNNAIRVYSTSGSELLPAVSTNQLFGVTPAIDRRSGINGVYPTDMRVFYDHTIDRWFVLQRSHDNDIFGNTINSSRLYMAVSQGGDPRGNYNIYVMDTTHGGNPGCPCFPDYPQIGADQYGFYIAYNEYSTYYGDHVSSGILAISKAALAAGTGQPATYRYVLPMSTGFEFAIQPASTPPGGSYFMGSGGVQYFVSTNANFAAGSELAVWAMKNTAALDAGGAAPVLMRTTVAALPYLFPDVATQKPGPLPYGATQFPPNGVLPFLDGGDSRVLSVVYAGGRLFATFASQVRDENGKSLVGGAYVILSPALRDNVLSVRALRQGYIMVKNNHVLRPAVAVNAQGRGAIVFGISGPDYYPSAAFVRLDATTTTPQIHVAALGAAPSDGFTGYSQPGYPGVARWGDYSAAVATSDGSIWTITEHIPDLPRTELANWGTYIARVLP